MGLSISIFRASAGEFTQAEHLGTHIDAPIHFIKGGKTIEEIPLQKLIGPGQKRVIITSSSHYFNSIISDFNEINSLEATE